MHTYLLEMLVCPSCRGKLEWEIKESSAGRIEQGRVNYWKNCAG
ncbi:MAG: hypothetical protein JXA42_19635 [Anaerolineales bacterium]|nr:hypothetical protein [Anaerolineales bacterium]